MPFVYVPKRSHPTSRSKARYQPKTSAQKKARMTAFRKKKSVRKYKPTANFTRQMTKYNNINAEKKIIPMKNYLNGPGSQGYLQDLPAFGLTSAGLTNNSLSCLVLQTGSELTNMNGEMNTDSGGTIAYALGGYALTQGIGANQMLGKYCKLTSTYLNLNITMDPMANTDTAEALDNSLPHQFRLIQVRARRDKMVAQGVHINDIGEPSIGYNLFLDETGKPKGIIDDMATQDAFTWFVNKQMWTVLREERFTLCAPTTLSTSGNVAFSPNVHQYKPSRFKKYWLPKPRNKVRYPFGSAVGSTLEPIDYNFVTHTIILCKNTSSGERASDHWNVQVNGATQFIDE
jgi:hypothetical protein